MGTVPFEEFMFAWLAAVPCGNLSTATLDLAWKGVTYHGAGQGTVEFMDLE